MDIVIEVEGLTHHYGRQIAVDNISFTVRQGEILGLLGPNGAGKTTTVRLLNGLFTPTAGRMRVLGMDPVRQGDQVRRISGVLTETPALYERLTARQNLKFFGTLAGMDDQDLAARSEELLSFFDLSARADSRAGAYSKGMKQRLALARALLHRPKLLFLDEPTSGLDPEAAQQVHELVSAIRRRNGHSVLLASHNLFEAERLCDRLAIMHKGRLLAIGSLDELRNQFAPGLWINITLLTPLSQVNLYNISLPGLLKVDAVAPLTLNLQVRDEAGIPPVVTHLVQNGAQIVSVERHRASLEEIYFKLQNQHKEGVQ
ncbi:MAG TPA: ABC transporter ATP-binding protein [Levilinea sp.]|nr:ABC transporter ATP-binding protein [Levilinea sp.]